MNESTGEARPEAGQPPRRWPRSPSCPRPQLCHPLSSSSARLPMAGESVASTSRQALHHSALARNTAPFRLSDAPHPPPPQQRRQPSGIQPKLNGASMLLVFFNEETPKDPGVSGHTCLASQSKGTPLCGHRLQVIIQMLHYKALALSK